ncbi:MAG: hypothetical protein ACLR2G_12305 [Phascolarctobacterium faecium]
MWYDLSLQYVEATPPEKLEALQKVLLDLGIKAYVGSDTPF